METKTVEVSTLVELYGKADKKTKKNMEDKFGKELFVPKPALITTWEQAAKKMKLHPVNSLPFPKPINQRQITANENWIMDIMCEVLNTDPITGKRWIPDYTNSNQYKWEPVYIYKPGVGFVFLGSGCVGGSSTLGSRLVFQDKATSDHAGKCLQPHKNRAFTI